MSYEGLAVILFRCSGVMSIVAGIFQFAAYLPMVWDVSPSAHGGSGVLRAALLPSAAGIVAGVVLLAFGKLLGRTVARRLE